MTSQSQVLIWGWILCMGEFCGSPAPCDDPSRRVTLLEFLEESGDQLNCYFSIERMADTRTTTSPLSSSRVVTNRRKSKDIEALIDVLTAELPGVTVMRNKDRKEVIHLIEGHLNTLNNYVMDKRVNVKLAGLLDDLEEPLARLDSRIGRPVSYQIIANTVFLGDLTTETEIDLKDCTIRDVLTKAVPLKGYSRIIWEATTTHEPGKDYTAYLFMGTKAAWDEAFGPKASE